MNYKASIEIIKIENTTKRDAKYFYYAHGPLARAEYGKNQVQGIDYAYTLQGWIKGVNSNTLKSNRDMGQDGLNDTSNLNQYFAEDAFGYTLGYFAGDYKAISGVKWNTVTNRFEAQTVGAQFTGQRHDLHNGNISHMVTTIVETNADSATSLAEPQTALPMANAYKYDQLNRLKKSLSFNNVSIPNNLWQASGQATPNMYENTFTYDASGNILTQNRYDNAGIKFESLDYRYKIDANGNLMQNRLYHVNDTVNPALYTDDIDNQGAFVSTLATINTVNNYRYDEIGNLIADSTEQIDTIKWTVYGKIKEIKRKAGSSKKNLKFDYDASQNRIAKHVLSSANSWENSTYYVRDADGNIMSTYDESVIDSSFSFKLKEQHLYGSSRIGIYQPEKEMIGADTTNEFAFDTLNKRVYEFSNHLGNVLTTVSDRKIALDANSDGIVDNYLADVLSATDYYSFGAPMPGRGFVSSDPYRYGAANGQEKTDEISGLGNHYTAQYWEYDPRLGRRWNVDPVKKPWQSDYSCYSDSPIWKVDPNGDDDYFNSQGKLILQTQTGTAIKVVTGTKIQTLSQLPMTDANRQLATTVLAHYATNVGVGNSGGTVGIKDAEKSSSKNTLAFTSGNSIYLNSKGGLSPLLDDINNMNSALEHEHDHLKKGQGVTKSSSFDHAEVFFTQMSSETFKSTTVDFKEFTAGGAAEQLTYAASEIGIGLNKKQGISDLKELIANFNAQSDKTGYTFSMTKNKQGVGYTVTAKEVETKKKK